MSLADDAPAWALTLSWPDVDDEPGDEDERRVTRPVRRPRAERR